MKKLLDENTDELTRALLEAGRSHRPPATSQAKLLVALGVGGSVGLLSSKAFAWLSSTSGKLTVLSMGVVGVGVAGALYGSALTSDDQAAVDHDQAAVSQVAVGKVAVGKVADGVAQVEARLSPAQAAPAHAVKSSKFVPAHIADAPSRSGRGPVAGLPAVNEGPARRENAPAASESPHRTARARKGSAVRRDDVREPRAPGLDSELQLVDAMRGAAQRNDTQALRGLVESYRGSFPDGQLRAEVAELAARALPH